MALDPTLETALGGDSVRIFHALRIELPAGDVNLIDGAGYVTFTANGQNVEFTTESAIAGTLASQGQIAESLATEAPRIEFNLLPPDTGGIADIGAVLAQGSPVYVWMGAINEATGEVEGQPLLLFTGFLDVVRITANAKERVVAVDCASGWERLFVASEGDRLNKHWHQSFWPGETGLDHAIDAIYEPIWGAEGPRNPGAPGAPAATPTVPTTFSEIVRLGN